MGLYYFVNSYFEVLDIINLYSFMLLNVCVCRRAELEQAGQLDKLDYDRGIWQSIGFKEFHGYLVLPPGERGTAAGQRLLAEGVEKMKVATRQYSRKQTRQARRLHCYKINWR